MHQPLSLPQVQALVDRLKQQLKPASSRKIVPPPPASKVDKCRKDILAYLETHACSLYNEDSINATWLFKDAGSKISGDYGVRAVAFRQLGYKKLPSRRWVLGRKTTVWARDLET